jgi:hypothetical protein
MYRGQPTVKQLQALTPYANDAVVPRLSLSPRATSRTPHQPAILMPCSLGLHSHPHPPASSCKRCGCPALPRTPYWSGTYPALPRSPGCCEECVPSYGTARTSNCSPRILDLLNKGFKLWKSIRLAGGGPGGRRRISIFGNLNNNILKSLSARLQSRCMTRGWKRSERCCALFLTILSCENLI